MLCTEIVSDIQNNFCTQHVLLMFCKKEELLTKIYLYRSMSVKDQLEIASQNRSFGMVQITIEDKLQNPI